MRKLLLIAAATFALAASTAAADTLEPVYDSCPNLDWAVSPFDAWVQSGDRYELKWSHRYGAYICVRQHP